MNPKFLAIFFFLFINVIPAFALERFDIVTTEELEWMLAQREAGKVDFVLMNTLDELIFKDRSIPHSVNVPWSRIDDTIGRLGSDKNKLVISY